MAAEAAPLEREVVSSFQSQVASGNVCEVKALLKSRPELANAKATGGVTPLMVVVSSGLDASRQIELINVLMKKKASLRARDDQWRTAGLRACQRGVEPKVMTCLERWSKKGGEDLFEHDDHDVNRDGALILAAKAGSLKLVAALLHKEILPYIVSRSNEPMRVLEAAIESGNESTVLYLLRFYKDTDDDDDDDPKLLKDFFDIARLITFSSLLRAAYDKNMLEAALFLGPYVPRRLWLCWRDGKKKKTLEDASSREKQRTFAKIETFAKEVQAEVINDINPGLLDILMARARRKKTNKKPTTTKKRNKLIKNITPACHPLVDVPDDIFRRIAAFAFKSLQQIEDTIRQEQDRHEREPICDKCKNRHEPFGCDATEYDSLYQAEDPYHQYDDRPEEEDY